MPVIQNLTESTTATVYGCCGLFDLCSDQDLMSLSMEGQNKFLDWIGWEASLVCNIRKNFITWVRPENSGGAATAGYLSDPCGDDHGAEWGECKFNLNDFARLRRHGPVRDVTETAERFCDAQPRYRLDGSPITNDAEYDMRITVEAMTQDLKNMIVTGSTVTGGQFDGLQRLVKTNYTDPDGRHCRAMNSIVINWNNNTMAGGAGMTWNGAAIAATFNFVDVLLAVFRRIRDRIAMAPALANAGLAAGDMIFVAPTWLIRCLLDHYTCWSVCDGAQYNEVNIGSYEARTFRDRLNGGMFGAGQISLDGFTIPMMPYDWGLTIGPTRADAYLLTGAIGNMKLINGQFLDMRPVPATYPDGMYAYTDGGKFLTWADQDETCLQRHVEFRPRLLMWAPWAQARFQNIKCSVPGGVLSPDPWETSFFPETSFIAPACITDSFDPAGDKD